MGRQRQRWRTTTKLYPNYLRINGTYIADSFREQRRINCFFSLLFCFVYLSFLWCFVVVVIVAGCIFRWWNDAKTVGMKWTTQQHFLLRSTVSLLWPNEKKTNTNAQDMRWHQTIRWLTIKCVDSAIRSLLYLLFLGHVHLVLSKQKKNTQLNECWSEWDGDWKHCRITDHHLENHKQRWQQIV